MKIKSFLSPLVLGLAGPLCTLAHDNGAAHSKTPLYAHASSAQPPPEMLEFLRDGKGIPLADSKAIKALAARYLSRRSNRPAAAGSSAPWAFTQRKTANPHAAAPTWQYVTTPFNPLDALMDPSLMLTSYTPPTGNGALMAASFGAFKPRVRFFWDSTTFYEESDNMPDNAQMPNLMVGITSWQQQVPLPAAYFASVTNPEGNAGSLGFGQPNYWRLPLTPTVATSPILIFTSGSTTNSFQRGAIALASNGIAIFNPANNTGRVSYEIGELDKYGGHCGLADDYHYHIIPTHLSSRFGGPLGDDKPLAWGLDGYPIYGFLEPNGTTRQALDSHGGHDNGNGWGYHYHAMGTTTADATHPYGTPQSPYTMTTFHGTVVNFGGQVDGQPEVGSLRASGTGGYTAQPVAGASITAFKNPVALSTDGSGHLVENVGGTRSQDSFLMRVLISGISYDQCWKINRNVNPRTLTITWRLSGATTTTTYTPGNATAIARLATYGMAG
ncbi:MAG: YHYH protein, partial [Chthoniobacteraceae bacterium]